MKIHHCLAIGFFFLFSFYSELNAQEITHRNYVSKFAEAQGHVNKGDYDEAAKLHYNLLAFLGTHKEVVADTIDIWYTKNYYSLSRMYLFEEDELSLRYADSTINSALRTNDSKLIFRGYSLKYYCLYYAEGEENTLNYLADECIKYAGLTNDKEDLAESYMHKCNALVELKQPEEAFSYCSQAETLFKQTTDERYLSSVYNNIANVFVKGGQIEKALGFYEKSHEYAIQLEDLDQFVVSARNIAEKNEMIGNYEIATNYYRDFGDSTKVQLTKKLESRFAEAEAKYQTEQKSKEIAQQQLEIEKQKNVRNIGIFGGFAALLVVFGLFQWRSNKQKRKKIAVEAELQKEQEINELRSKFLGNIAHEIRTPLTLITGNLDLALDNFDNSEKAKNNIKTALSNSKKVASDANEILELLKFEKNKTKLKVAPIRLDQTLKRMSLSFKSLAEMKNLNLIYQSNIEKEYVTQTDVEKLEKIVNNLVSNAIKHSPSGKDVIVDASVQHEQLEVRVTDYGQGIHYDETEKIFERFYQTNDNNTVGGIGIGLSLAREFAFLLGGTLEVESEKGVGSTFILLLSSPQLDTAILPNESTDILNTITYDAQPEANVSSKTIKPKILIVEDNPEMCAYLVEILSVNYECTTAFDGQEALEKIKETRFDLITSDIMMPRMDGFQLREALNQHSKNKNIPFILISAKTLEDDKIKGFKLGVDDYIIKPFNKNELVARIDNLLKHKTSRDLWMLQNEDLLSESESSDQKLLKKIELVVIENLSNENFKIAQLGQSVGYSQRQLTRILKQYTGMTPVQFILEIRLQKAYNLLQQKTYFTLSEVRYNVGINSSTYFNKKFKERFGITPSELLS